MVDFNSSDFGPVYFASFYAENSVDILKFYVHVGSIREVI